MTERIDHQRFISLVGEHFLDIAASIDDCRRGLLHPEMGAFAHATRAAIDAQDHETVLRHFRFIDEVFRNAAPDVENAVYVSYLENLRFEGHNAELMKARALLTPGLRQALSDLEAHLAQLFIARTARQGRA